jgi:hypothetical protein
VIAAFLSIAIASQMRSPVSAGRELDFWVGNWKVYVGKDFAGTDVVTKSLNGFSITESWHGASKGDNGSSLFYYMPAKKQWKQVWVTGIGVYKEKLSAPVPNGIRFSGTVFLPRGRTYQDRTTLTTMPNGEVHQVIESLQGGKWVVGFDAVYRKA